MQVRPCMQVPAGRDLRAGLHVQRLRQNAVRPDGSPGPPGVLFSAQFWFPALR